MGKVFLRIMYDKNTLNTPLYSEGFYNNNAWSNTNYFFISGPTYEIDNLKDFQNNSRLLLWQPANIFDSSDKYDLPRTSNYYHTNNDGGTLDENMFYGDIDFKGGNNNNPSNGLAHDHGNLLYLSNKYPTRNYMSTYNTVVVGNEHTVSNAPTQDQLIFYPYLTYNLPYEALPNYDIKISNTDSSSHAIDSFHNHGLVSGRKYTIEITNNNKKDYTT